MQNPEIRKSLKVDLDQQTGQVKHGAAGFLYGLGKEDIPSVNTLAPLKPQVAAQKPEGGLQHPNGDALNASRSYFAAGGREIEVYIQDIYPNWPYDRVEIQDYLRDIERVVRQVAASPNRSRFSYVPFNEIDAIWYNKTDKKQAFFEDWKLAVQKIKSIDPDARIVGPNLCAYDSPFYQEFLAFGKRNDCLPEVISWHELSDSFFASWYESYEDYRRHERELEIAPREICINEYTRINGDLGNPGKLIQWITRFENSKVDACLAYWTDAGSLNNLVARDHHNRVTGAWWLYRWYGGLTGETVRVTPPDANAEGLQGLAALDAAKKQARILLGGIAGDAQILVRGFQSTPYFGEQVTAAVWVTRNTGLQAAEDPQMILTETFPIVQDQIEIPLAGMEADAAYQVIIRPYSSGGQPAEARFYPAEFADLSGGAALVYQAETGAAWVSGTAGGPPAGTTFVVTAEQDGFYEVRLRYSSEPASGTSRQRHARLTLNGAPLTDLTLPASTDSDTICDWHTNLFLTAGINRITIEALPGTTGDDLHLHALQLALGQGWSQSYEAEAAQMSGTAAAAASAAASGGAYVCGIGNGEENALSFNNIQVPQAGQYRLIVTFANAAFQGEHAYNSQVIDRHADVVVNGGGAQRYYFRNTFTWDNFQSRVIDVSLQAGSNTIQFCNRDRDAEAPHIDRIEIAEKFSLS